MAQLTAIIGADTSKFVSGIKSAQDMLDKFVKETNSANQSTEKNISVTNEQAAAYQRVVKQLEKVGSGTMSTSQQQKALADQVKELKVQWQNLSDQAKSSDFGKSMADTMKLATNELSNLKTQLASIDEIQPTQKLKTQLRQTTEELQNLSVKYALLTSTEKSSPFGVELASKIDEVRKKAGGLKDVISDVDAEIKIMASDTPHLDAFNQGITIGADLISTYTSFVAKLTGDTDKLKDAIATIATVQSFANLTTKLATQLQSSSILMMKTRKVQEAAAAAAIRIRTAAEGKGMLATKGATAAQAAFNIVAKANPYVLLASAVLAVGAAVFAFTRKTKDATDALSSYNKVQDAYKKKMEETNEEVGLAIGKFKILESQYKSLQTAAEKQEWIKKNSDKFNELGLSIGNVNDADKVFIQNSDKVIKAMRLRAEAAAMQAVYQEQYAEAYKNSLKIAEGKQDSFMSSGSFRGIWNKAGIGEGDYTHTTTMMQSTAGAYSQSVYSLTDSGIAKMQAYWKQQGETAMQAFTDGASGMLADMASKITEAEQLEAAFKTTGGGSGSGSGSNPEIRNRVNLLEEEKKKLQAEIPTVDHLGDRYKEIQLRIIDIEAEIANLNAEEQAWLRSVKARQIEPLSPIAIELPNRVELPKSLQPGIILPVRVQVQKKTFAEVKEEIDGLVESYDKLAGGASGIVGSINSVYESFKNLNKELEDAENGWESFFTVFQAGMTVLDGIATMIQSITTIMEVLNTVKQTGTQITQQDTNASIQNTTAKVGEAGANTMAAGTAGAAAAAEAGKSVASIPYVGPILAVAAIASVMAAIIGIIASAKSFAGGGIIQGNTSVGDYNIARVNSGEMILNGSEQKRLFNLLDGNTGMISSGSTGGQVEFKIKGTELVGVINNVNKKRSKL